MHGTSEFTDREDKVITDAAEVKQLEDFIFNKVRRRDARTSVRCVPVVLPNVVLLAVFCLT